MSTLPIYLIAMTDNADRKQTIQALVDRLDPIVVEAIKDANPWVGNCLSHLRVAELAKKEFPESSYMVLEDDAVIRDEKVWSLVEEHKDVDILYLGYNGLCNHTIPVNTEYVWGTHALVVSPKARDAIIDTFETILTLKFWTTKIGFDSMLTVVQSVAKLTSWKPPFHERYNYICQKEGLVSMLSGTKRQNIIL